MARVWVHPGGQNIVMHKAGRTESTKELAERLSPMAALLGLEPSESRE